MTSQAAAVTPDPAPDSAPTPAAGMIACGACGKTLHQTAPICPHCGASQRSRGYKSKVAAGLLAIFLGGLGVHRFYLGQWWGVFYLLLFWTLVPGLIALIEGIVFLVANQESWDQRHNEGKPNLGGEGSVGLVIALVAGVFAFIMVLGILAAIAIPAYQDYVMKARVVAALNDTAEARNAVEQFIVDRQTYPGSNADVGLAEGAASGATYRVDVQEGGVIVLTFTGSAYALKDKTVIYTPIIENNTLTWDCREGTLSARYRTAACR
jgi:Tfp pilus assembly major pilin PilA/TM2 domain-containing membrane protein YozV